jgi:hypothetical protein
MRPRFRLPALLRRARNPLWYFVYWAPFIALYQLTNRVPLFEPRELPYTALDRLVPFVPALLPLYVAYIPFYWWTIVRSESDAALNRTFYATHVLLLVSLPFFVGFPVRMPREQFYGPDAHGWADAFWRWFDAPNNCLPSLHVATALLLVQLNWPRPYRLLHTTLGLGIAASTVFVKQHYVVDVAAGVLCYLAARWFLARLEVTGRDADGMLAPLPDARSFRGRAREHRGGTRGPPRPRTSDVTKTNARR